MPVCRRSNEWQEGSSSRSTVGDEQNLPYLSLAEVRKHNTPDDCWMIIHGGVYDVGSFLNKHPGGSQILLKYAGMDATLPFDDVGHSMESLRYDMPAGSLKGFFNPKEPLQDRDDDIDCITMAHDRSFECRAVLNKFYTLLLYTTIVICVILLMCTRMRWHSQIEAQGTMVHKIRHHVRDSFASPDTHQEPREEEFGIPAWAY